MTEQIHNYKKIFFIEDVYDIEKLNVEKINLVGFSIGSLIALDFASGLDCATNKPNLWISDILFAE